MRMSDQQVSEVSETREKPHLFPINAFHMIWLPFVEASKERVVENVCQVWPASLKDKLSLVPGFFSQDYMQEADPISALMESPSVLSVLSGLNVTWQTSRAAQIFTDDGKKAHQAGAVALFLGHIAAWTRIIDSPEEGFSIVLEDDAVLDPSVELEQITFPDVNGSSHEKPLVIMLDPRHRNENKTTGCWDCPYGCGSVAYAINRAAAKRFIEQTDLGFVVDMFLDHQSFKVCPLLKAPFAHGSKDRNHSLVRGTLDLHSDNGIQTSMDELCR